MKDFPDYIPKLWCWSQKKKQKYILYQRTILVLPSHLVFSTPSRPGSHVPGVSEEGDRLQASWEIWSYRAK